MATRKFIRKSKLNKSKSQRAGKRYKKISTKRRGGFIETISTGLVPFGLVAAKRAYGKKMRGSTRKMGSRVRKTLRRLSGRR